MPGAQGWSRWRFLISPRWLAWHAFVAASVTGMLLLGDWQLHRAEAGNALSWAYTFEWPFFAVLGVVFWGKTIRDEVHPPTARAGVPVAGAVVPARAAGAAAGAAGGAGAGEPATPEDEELAAYNAYLARLHQEVKGHGRWHGLR
jgi:hypothetical protein